MQIVKDVLGKIYKILHRKYYNFSDSASYWEARYRSGRNSGDGSYGKLAKFKADFLNRFVSENYIDSVIEFGCGDGNQLLLANYENYIGFDVSEFAIKKCKKIFKVDTSKEFYLVSNFRDQRSDLTISLDVIYHLVENDVFQNYMELLFKASKKYVIVYSSNEEQLISDASPHVRHRKFSDWIEVNVLDFELVHVSENKFIYNGEKGTSFSSFYVYKKIIVDKLK